MTFPAPLSPASLPVAPAPFDPDRALAAERQRVAVATAKAIHPAVIMLFNQQISEKWNGRFACLYQQDIQAAADLLGIEMTEKEWSVEPLYRDQGWYVQYQRPAYYGDDDRYRHFYVFHKEPLTSDEYRSCYQYL